MNILYKVIGFKLTRGDLYDIKLSPDVAFWTSYSCHQFQRILLMAYSCVLLRTLFSWRELPHPWFRLLSGTSALASIWNNSEGHSHSSLWVELPILACELSCGLSSILPNPAFFISIQDLFLNTLSNKPSSYKFPFESGSREHVLRHCSNLVESIHIYG